MNRFTCFTLGLLLLTAAPTFSMADDLLVKEGIGHLQSWIVRDGRTTLLLDGRTLHDHKFDLRAAHAGSISAGESQIVLPIVPGSEIEVRMIDGHAVLTGGLLDHLGGLGVASDAARAAYDHPTVELSAHARRMGMLLLLDSDGRADVGLWLHEVEIRLDAASSRVVISADAVVATEGLAALLDRPKLARVSLGQVMIEATVDRLVDGRPAPAVETPLAEPSGAVAGGIGPDIIVRDLYNTGNYGNNYDPCCGFCISGPKNVPVCDPITLDCECPAEPVCDATDCISGFAIGTISCNIGDEEVMWESNSRGSNQHPVIGQHLYRLKDHRFEQIGLSWVKHGFFAVDGNQCQPFTCQANQRGDRLGIHCSDPYSASLNGQQNLLGPRSAVNAHTGFFPVLAEASPSCAPGCNDRRILVKHEYLDPTLNAGAKYFSEALYVSPDDAQAGNGNNNASWRLIHVLQPPGIERYEITYSGPIVTPPTRQQQPAIRAWRETDPSVVLANVQIPNEGLVFLGAKAWQLPNGLWRYEYAVQNQNSDRSIGSFRVPLPAGSVLTNIGFHGVEHHSGEPYDNSPWPAEVVPGQIEWATTPWHLDANANAIRWGTLYNFRFDANIQASPTNITLGLFKPGPPGAPTEISVTSIGPAAGMVDCNDNGIMDVCDLTCDALGCEPPCGESLDCNNNNIPDECEPDCMGNGFPDSCDLADCPPGEVWCQDCNNNGLPDACDIASGLSEDCDGNGVPDECEVLADSDQDGVPDCRDACPLTTPPGGCICPELDECCWPWGACIPPGIYTREQCIEFGGAPTCGETPCRDGCLMGDYHEDGAVDLRDVHHLLADCFSGPDGGPAFAEPSEACLFSFDYDEDGAVDLTDYNRFREDMTGPR